MSTAIQITPLALSYKDLLLELATGVATFEMLNNALFFMDCSPEYLWDERTALEKLNADKSLTRCQKQVVHQRLMALVSNAIEEDRAVWRAAAEGTWDELNKLLELNGVPRIPVPFYDHLPIMREYSPQSVALAVKQENLPYLVFPYQAI